MPASTPSSNVASLRHPPAPVRVAPAFEIECVEFFADVVQMLGVPKSVGQIYGLLFASPLPLSFTDVSERLDLSRGSASQGLQFLRALGAVHSVKSEEGRRELFTPELGLRKLVGGLLREKVEPIVADGGQRMVRLRQYAKEATGESAVEFSLDRVRQIETWRGQMNLLLPILKTILGRARS